MRNSLVVNRMKVKWPRYAVVAVLASILSFYFYPIGLEKAIGISDITVDDISDIWVSMVTYHQPDGSLPVQMEIFTKGDITDEAFIEEVLSALSNHTMRRTIGRGPYYFPVNPEKAGSIDLIISFEEPSKYSSITIFNAKLIGVNSTVMCCMAMESIQPSLWNPWRACGRLSNTSLRGNSPVDGRVG